MAAEAGHGGGHQLGSHYSVHVTEGIKVHLDTLVATWMVMAFLILIAFLVGRTVSRTPTKQQSLVEGIVEFVEGIVRNQIGPNAMMFLPYIGTLFLFIWASNWFGLLPWRALTHFGVPGFTAFEVMAPTADLNTTVALALLTSMTYFFFGIKKKGISYFAHYFQPETPGALILMKPLFIGLNLMEDIARPLSLAMRLFGNIMAEETVGIILLALVPWLIPLPMMALGLFVSVVQAFVFAFLSAMYIGHAVHEHEHHEQAHAAGH